MSGGRRSNADELLVVALAGGEEVRRAAEAAGVSEATAFRRLRDDAFRKRVYHVRAEIIGGVVGRLASRMGQACDVLAALLGSEDEKIRLSAARGVLELGFKGREAIDNEEMLTEVLGRLKAVEEERETSRRVF